MVEALVASVPVSVPVAVVVQVGACSVSVSGCSVLCARPYKGSFNTEFPCGKCLSCKVNHQRVWLARLLLESQCHLGNAFLTLTYREEDCPPELLPREVQKYIKRLRRDKPLRYYLVGEYGGLYGRPHYHILVFGIHWTEEAFFQSHWPYGNVHVGDVNNDTISYTIGYLTAKNTHETNKREAGREPEFVRMSRNPGIGGLSIPALARSVVSSDGEVYLPDGDVPCTMRIEKKLLPMGSYLVKKFRESLGRSATVPEATSILRSIRSSAESAEDRSARRRSSFLSVSARTAIKQSKRKL